MPRGVVGRNERQRGGNHQSAEQLQCLWIEAQQCGLPIVDTVGRMGQKRDESDPSANLTGERLSRRHGCSGGRSVRSKSARN